MVVSWWIVGVCFAQCDMLVSGRLFFDGFTGTCIRLHVFVSV